MGQTKQEKEAAQKRSEAAKKAAETRRQNAEAEAAEKTDQEKFDETQRGGRKVGKAQNAQGPRGGRKVGKTADDESGPRGGRKVGKEYQPTRQPLEAAGLDQHDAEAKRQAELTAERDEHNRRTGDASLPNAEQPRGGRKVGKGRKVG